MTLADNNPPPFTTQYPNLAQERLGCLVIDASDEFFADKSRLISPTDPVFIPDKFDDHGKWMDGWETRRRREGGNDWCIIKLGQTIEIAGIDIDTSHFTGNYPPACAIEISSDTADTTSDTINWQPFIAQMPLKGNSHHYIKTPFVRGRYLRLSIYPDGGIARLRVYGRVIPPPNPTETIDLIALVNGGRVIEVSDSHFGAPNNMLMPHRGINMGDGWETRRRREPGNDWAVLALGTAGIISRIEVDTAHFRGNYPAAFSLYAAHVPQLDDTACVTASTSWQPLFAKTPLTADAEHCYTEGILINDPISHIRFNIYPDGGISRLRLFGRG